MKLIKRNSVIIIGVLVAMLILSENAKSKSSVMATAKTKVMKNNSEAPIALFKSE